MPKLHRQIDEMLLAIALMYQRPGVSAWKRDIARRYLRRRFGPIAQRALVVGVRVAVVAGVARRGVGSRDLVRKALRQWAAALPVSPAPHPDGAGVSPRVTAPPDTSP
jgi:hypothetical protein